MTISVFTLGCKTNLYESLQICATLTNNGYKASHGLKKADVFVLNTCAVTSEAEKKSRQAVARAKKLNPNCMIIVLGCASQNSRNEFLKIPNVVAVQGNANKENIVEIIENLEGQIPESDSFLLPKNYIHTVDASEQKTRAFLKIQDGCNNFCSYCIIPYLRGRSRSKSISDILTEAQNTSANEIVLVGIDISQFGKDNNQSLEELLVALKPTNKRIRLGSLECRVVTDEFLKAVDFSNFCPHFHLSLQSGCDLTLARMNRKYTTSQFLEVVKKIRTVFDSAAITTDVIVGFSGETDDEFLQTVEFLQKCQFADIHVFPYSRRKGSAAYNLPDVDSETKKARAEVLAKLKAELRSKFLSSQIGKDAEVLVEYKKNGLFSGYTKNYTRVYIDGNCKIGSVVEVKLNKPYNDGLKGELKK